MHTHAHDSAFTEYRLFLQHAANFPFNLFGGLLLRDAMCKWPTTGCPSEGGLPKDIYIYICVCIVVCVYLLGAHDTSYDIC